jgi:glycosyltransferase involved in cell wall biosynthesis
VILYAQSVSGEKVTGFQTLASSDAPIVSVVVPCFNRAQRLGPTLDSVLGQTFSNWEVIVVDDGSSDNLVHSIERYSNDSRIRLERHHRNLGASAARNTGVRAARGRFVAFLDSDDIWLPRKLEHQVAALSAVEHPDHVLCATQTFVVGAGGWRCVRPHRGPAAGRSFGEFLYNDGGFAQTSSFLLSAALARRVPFRESLWRLEDHMFFIDLGIAGAGYLLVADALTVWNDDERPDRLAMSGDIDSVLGFLDQAVAVLPAHVRRACEARLLSGCLWPQSPARSLTLLCRALRTGALSPWQVGGLFCRNIMPPRAYGAVRHWLT